MYMRNKQPVEINSTIVNEYFDIVVEFPNIQFKLKRKFKENKSPPIKKITEKGRVVSENGIKYYTYYLGEEIGNIVYTERKKLFCMFNYIPWVIRELLPEDKEKWEGLIREKKELDSKNLNIYLSSEEGKVTKGKWKAARIKNAKNQSNAMKVLWEDPIWKKTYMDKKISSGTYKIVSEKRKKYLSDPDNFKKFMLSMNSPERIKKISDNAKLVWSYARNHNIDLFNRMMNNSCNKNFEIRGIRMNSIEFKVATILDDLQLKWDYETVISKQSKSYIPDFIIHKNDKKYILECYGDLWHANPDIYKINEQTLKGIYVKDIWKKDIDRKYFFESLGYSFTFYWESDINNNIEYIKQQIYEYTK